MTPIEKAQQLIYAFEAFTDRDNEFEFAKQCSLIAVDEILEVVKFYERQNGRLLIDNIRVMYWQEVKNEIEKL